MPKGFPFKLMQPKDISQVMALMGFQFAPELIDRPTEVFAHTVCQNLAQFAYDMDIQQIRAVQMPQPIQNPEIYDDAVDVLAVFKLCKQIALINQVEDFNFKDLWEPTTKRLRVIMSSIINFCRYKEARMISIDGMKESVVTLDCERMALASGAEEMAQKVRQAAARHNEELPDMWQAEQQVSEARASVEKLSKSKANADRVVDDAEAKLHTTKDRVIQSQLRVNQLREQVAGLADQIAESPEGLEAEIEELQAGIRQQKAWLEEKSSERRARAHRVQVLGRLAVFAEKYRDELFGVEQAAGATSAAVDRAAQAKDELAAAKMTLQASRAQQIDLEQACKQVNAEIEQAKQTHKESTEQLKLRQQHAFRTLEELQAQQIEEQRRCQLLLSQRLELESEDAAARRAHEAEMNELREQKKAIFEQSESYAQSVEALLAQHGYADGAMYVAESQHPTGSPESLMRKLRRPLSSPSPARLAAERRLLASPTA